MTLTELIEKLHEVNTRVAGNTEVQLQMFEQLESVGLNHGTGGQVIVLLSNKPNKPVQYWL